MKKIFFASLCLAFVFQNSATAQTTSEKRNKKEEKTVIVIQGDSIRINSDSAFMVKGLGYSFNDRVAPRVVFGSRMLNKTFLGVTMKDSNGKGAEILTVVPKSPAEKAGLKAGDLITRIDKDDIKDSKDLTEKIQSMKPDDKVSIEYRRDGKKKTATATLDKSSLIASGFNNANWNQFTDKWPGVVNGFMTNINVHPKMGMQVQETENSNGVKVLSVEENSPAAKAGIKEGDLITEINGSAIKNIGDITGEVKDKSSGDSELKILRDGKTLNIKVHVPKPLRKANL